MGSSWVKLKKAVENGDEAKALELYNRHSEIKNKLNANAILNEQTLDTFLHLSAYHGMTEFMRLLLKNNNGNPNKLNRKKQTALHRLCQGHCDTTQYECMKLMFEWRDPLNNSLNTTTTQQQQCSSTPAPNETTAATKQPKNQNQTQNALPMAVAENDEKKSSSSSTASTATTTTQLDLNVNSKDDCENTPLHYAAMNNLLKCVKTLINNGAYLFVENSDHSTPVDLAERNGQKEMALYLESKMIFSNEEEEKENLDDLDCELIKDDKQIYGLKIQDLQAEKDKLLVETADMLRCNIWLAEILLKNFHWSKELLLNSWVEDQIKCFEKCGLSSSDYLTFIQHSNSLNKLLLSAVNGGDGGENFEELNKNNETMTSNNNDINYNLHHHSILNGLQLQSINNTKLNKNNNYCNICMDYYLDEVCVNNNNTEDEKKVDKLLIKTTACGHLFCRACWEKYLTMKIDEGNVSNIICPQVNCFSLVPHELVEQLISKETAQKYLHFDIRAFVDSNPDIKWCPFPGCGNAVRNPRIVTDPNSPSSAGVELSREYSRSVDCGSGHYFCWDCLQEGHEPASCKNWKDWFQKILEIKPEELRNINEKEEQSANYLWLVTNSKRCPNPSCNSPIQKNEGCNHVKCYKCKHDFCWICLEPWKKHSSLTGGYFQCNRYEVSNKIIQKEKSLIAEAEENHLKTVELNKFVHYYTRFKNHEHSYKIEEPLLAQAKTKFENLFLQTNALNNRTETIGGADDATDLAHHRALSTSVSALSTAAMCHHDSSDMNNNNHTNKNNNENTESSNNATNAPLSGSHSQQLSKSLTQLAVDENTTLESNLSKTLTSSNKKDDTATSPSLDKLIPHSQNQNENLFEINEVSSYLDDSNHYQQTSDSKKLLLPNSKSQQSVMPSENSKTKEEQQQQHLFIEDAIKELLKARRILRCSYVYGYYLDTFGHKKFIFEFIQTEFEECTENLSQIIARPHLKTPKHKIIRLTNLLRRKRLEFIDTITRGLNSFNDTPPTLKKYSRQRWKYLLKDNIQNDDEFKNAVAISLKELNPRNPWIIDKKGRHTNLLALLNDWPELEQELDSILVPSKEKNGMCAKRNCINPKAINTLSGSLCNYCSIKCMRNDRSAFLESRKSRYGNNHKSEANTDQKKAAASYSKELTSASTATAATLKSAESIDSLTSLCDDEETTAAKNQQQKQQNMKTEINLTNNNHNSNNSIAFLPYNSLFLTASELDVSIIISNMDNMCNLNQKQPNEKIAKVCNFHVKAKNI